jgi:hypothetical protein
MHRGRRLQSIPSSSTPTVTGSDATAPAAPPYESGQGDRVHANGRTVAVILAGILAVASLIRLFKLTGLALWFDEASSLTLSSYPWPTLLQHIRADTLAPLYFAALKSWCGLFGQSVIALRSLSVVFGVASVGVAFLFAREAFRNDRLALLSALMIALNPLQVEYARQVRMYTMGVFLVLLASYLLARAIRRGRSADWLGYALVAAACLYTHYFLLFSVAAQATVALGTSLTAPPSRRRGMVAAVGGTYAGVAMVFAPWVPAFLEQQRHVASDFWVAPLNLAAAVKIPWAVLLGSSDAWASIPLAVLVAIVAVALIVLQVRRGTGWPDWLLVAQALLPIGAALALSIHHPIVVSRYFLFASASWSIIAASAATLSPRLPLRRAMAASLVLVTLYGLERNFHANGLLALRHAPLNPPGIAGAAEYINRRAAHGDAIVVTNSLIYFSFNYYNRATKALLHAPTLESIPAYSGGAMLKPDDLVTDLHRLCCPRRVWYLWTDGFNDRRPQPPSEWTFASRSRFVDAPGYKGSIYVEEFLLSQPGQDRRPR